MRAGTERSGGLEARELRGGLDAGGPRGFTLIEVLVSAGIASVVLLVGFYAITTTITTSKVTTQRVRDTENARLFFQMLERDLATAVPGVPPMPASKKGVAREPGTEAIVLTTKPGAVRYDMLQFYCRSDEPKANGEDTLLFVRYYTNYAAGVHSLCRAVRPVVQGMAIEEPYAMMNKNDFTDAIFSNVRNINVTFQYWSDGRDGPARKQYVKVDYGPDWNLSDPSQAQKVALCDSILVSIVFTNEYEEKQLNNKTAKAQGNYEDRLTKTYRSYSKILQLPATFK